MTIDDYDRLPSKRVAVDGGEMFTIDVGRGPAVLLVHGNPVSSLEFRTAIEELSPRFRVVAPDLLTFGRSTGPESGAGFTEQSRALRGLLDALGLDRFHFVGHDWGGPIGLAAAAEKPDQVDRMVLINTSIRADFEPPLAWRPMTSPAIGELAFLGGNVMSLALPLLMRAAQRNGKLRRRYEEPMARSATRRTMLKLERRQGYGAACRRIERALPGMHGPKLLIWGTGDPYFRREYRRLEEAIPDLRRITLPGAGHFGPEDAPKRVSRHLLEFLTTDRPDHR